MSVHESLDRWHSIHTDGEPFDKVYPAPDPQSEGDQIGYQQAAYLEDLEELARAYAVGNKAVRIRRDTSQ